MRNLSYPALASASKAKFVAACLQGDASIAQAALQHGLYTDLIQLWFRQANQIHAVWPQF